MPRMLLIRHCESIGQAPEAPLTEHGRAQALALAAHLAQHPIDYVVSSPYVRACETIAPFAGRAQLAVHIDERLAERRLSPEPIDHCERSFENRSAIRTIEFRGASRGARRSYGVGQRSKPPWQPATGCLRW